MRAVVQRVREARVTVGGEVVGAIGHGLCVLLGVAAGDSPAEADLLSRKIVGLRIFDDDAGQMNRAVDDVGGALLVVSQFTLHADCRRGRRPSFTAAAPAAHAQALYDRFVATARATLVPVETGRFQAHMALALVVSQFTLHADCRRGRRPSFTAAAPAAHAEALYDRFVATARATLVPVETGRFQAHMALALVNDGPVTIVLDTSELRAA